MKRRFLALTVGVLLLLVAGVGTATASLPASESTGQLAGSAQDAGALAGTAQQEPSNSNVSVRVLSPGDDGPVSQANVATSDATAANRSATEQSADQTQAGGSGQQTIGQSATNAQDAFALALTAQRGASNENAPVRVLSPGNTGGVSQANVASSEAAAGNANSTGQTADQSQGGTGCCDDGGSQVAGQSAASQQEATALSATKQERPSNTNVSVRVLSPGDDGPVSQANVATSDATAANGNTTKQSAEQARAGSCKCGDAGTQVIGQSAANEQSAKAAAVTEQKGASNTNISVRVLSPGSNGPVSQVNIAASNATAANLNATEQSADQTQRGGSCKCGGAGTQVIGQLAENEQTAAALAATVQEKPSNTNVGVRVLSPGDDGPVRQANVATSDATAANWNGTKQSAAQAQAGGSGLQAIGQSAANHQDAAAIAFTFQSGASNENAPVRVLSPGKSGGVSQASIATSSASAGNVNWTEQEAAQLQGGSSGVPKKGCCGPAVQALGQLATSSQSAAAVALTVQLAAKQPCRCKGEKEHGNVPSRVLSPGKDGPVRQLNLASSHAEVGNWNATKQKADQIQAPPCVCLDPSIQALGQAAYSGQSALGLAATLQLGAPLRTSPVPKKGSEPERKVMPVGIE